MASPKLQWAKVDDVWVAVSNEAGALFQIERRGTGYLVALFLQGETLQQKAQMSGIPTLAGAKMEAQQAQETLLDMLADKAKVNPAYTGAWTKTPTPWPKPRPKPTAPRAKPVPRAKPAPRAKAVEGLPVEYVDAADGRIYGIHLSRGGTPVLWETREMRSDATYTSGEEPESMQAWYAALRSLPQKKAKKRAKKKAKKRAKKKNPSRADILRRAMRGT